MKINDSLLPKKKNFYYHDLLIGFIFTVLLISLGVLLAIYFRPLYYLDIEVLNIKETTGLSGGEIKSNYDALINYCSPFFSGALVFPTLPASPSGLFHFSEVKAIFLGFHIAALVSLIFYALAVFFKIRADKYGYLLISSITAIILPLIVGIACFINFNASFTLMHKLFFNNNDWLFDPETDPIINLLPETYFLHCAVLVIVIVAIGSIISLFCFFRAKNNRRTEELLPMTRNYFY